MHSLPLETAGMKGSVALGLLLGLACPLALSAQAAPAADSLAQAARAAAAANRVAINCVWTLVAGFLVMFMQAGFALVETGFTRAKNAAHTMTMNFMVYGIAMLAYWAVGFALQAGGVGPLGTLGGYDQLSREVSVTIGGKTWGLFGGTGFFLTGVAYTAPVFAYFLFQMVFMDTAATIPTGALAERWKFAAFAVFSVFVGAIIYPIYANWTWGGGWLSALGKNLGLGHGHVDFAGSSVWRRYGKPDPSMLANGTLAGLVAITAPCAFVTAPAAVLIGGVAGVLVCAAVVFVERSLKIDDPVGAISVHGVCGLWGILSVGLLADGTYGAGWNGVDGAVRGVVYGDASQLLAQLVGGVTHFVAVRAMAYVAYQVSGLAVGGHRVSAEVEELGLDVPEMGVEGYTSTPEAATVVVIDEQPVTVPAEPAFEPQPEAI